MIKSIVMRNIKGANTEQELTGRDIITGGNGLGKTTRAQALGVALMGYVPGAGKLPAETIKLASGGTMTVGLKTDSFEFTRAFARKGAKIEQSISLMPPGDERTAAEKEQRIEAELGRLPVMLDFNEFLGMSDMKRREFIFNLAEADGQSAPKADAAGINEILRERLKVSEIADPEERKTFESDIAECVDDSPITGSLEPGDDSLQSRLQAMHVHAKDQSSFWKKELEKATGASQKIAEYKNELDETDRNLDANKAKIEELRKTLTEINVELANAENKNSQIAAANVRITAIEKEIDDLERAMNPNDPENLRELIAQYGAEIRNVDNRAAIADLCEKLEKARELKDAKESIYNQLREDYGTEKGKWVTETSLLDKIRQQSGMCAIDNRIKCDKDFADFIRETEEEIADINRHISKMANDGLEARTHIENAKADIEKIERSIRQIQSEEVSVLRENEQLQRLIANLQNDLRDAENFETDRAARLNAKREELRNIGGRQDLADTSEPRAMLENTHIAIHAMEEKIAEQTKARNTLANLKSSMIDSTVAGYHAEAWKRIAEAVGPKGLQGEFMKDTLAPLSDAIQEKLRQMEIDKIFYFQTEDDRGKEIFQFGWRDADDERRNFDALSTGEQMLLLIALMTTIIERINPPLKALIIDNAETLDRENLRRVLRGLTTAGANLDNIMFLGVMDIDPADYPAWRVWNLGGGAA
jgi:exonuclease SbcC